MIVNLFQVWVGYIAHASQKGLHAAEFRRDQVWFVEKDNAGASHLYPLLEFSPRKGESLAKWYLQGRYGAIPFIEGFAEGLLSNKDASDDED